MAKHGDKVALAFGSGNRDWRKFTDPDVYDIDRRPQGHLGFGIGKHFCLGSQMARLVTGMSMKRFLARVPDSIWPMPTCPGIRRLTFAVRLRFPSQRIDQAALIQIADS
jgi:cytochrome P450